MFYFQPGASGSHLSSHTTYEAEIRRIEIPGLPGEKVGETLSQWKKAGRGGGCLSSSEGGKPRRGESQRRLV
jgi:hypothetical protein